MPRSEIATDGLITGGLSGRHSLADIGTGYSELDMCLRTAHGWQGRYVSVDRGTGPVDLEMWSPPIFADPLRLIVDGVVTMDRTGNLGGLERQLAALNDTVGPDDTAADADTGHQIEAVPIRPPRRPR
ncbi:hypothetical protein [Kitasatospora sp. CB02891]|uniref:hypothetical protein n=1 Tax=Kitasatospora sp. CB02891 TaxID=2020329 RepID=UPI000C273573|nr:hypothetical protein [Kitasatospora sp. CB02891]PJN25677.1 hypothetical protein CG736_15025 [Kitasatospora sp. CB02891]